MEDVKCEKRKEKRESLKSLKRCKVITEQPLTFNNWGESCLPQDALQLNDMATSRGVPLCLLRQKNANNDISRI